MDKKSILIFGVGELQKSIIMRAKNMGLYVIGIDPCMDAVCKHEVDVFEIVDGQDYEGTLHIARKYNIKAVVTAATDKPLVMMARIAKELGLRFYSEETAKWSTDKFQMKERFLKYGIPCAHGRVIKHASEASDLEFPLILKPRDNSGSRGVILCQDILALEQAMEETFQHTRLNTVLVEEFIEGLEYSIESLHYNGKCEVIQFTEKRTTPFPYNVELSHIQPANITEDQKNEICSLINKIGEALHYENCPSHTELKINSTGIYIIETSPRLGGDYITSTLTPLSTGINIEDQLLHIALGEDVDCNPKCSYYSGIRFFAFNKNSVVKATPNKEVVLSWPHVVDYSLKLSKNDYVNLITSSLNRYGHIILQTESRESMDEALNNYEKIITKLCLVSPLEKT